MSTQTAIDRVEVNLGPRSYPILISTGWLDRLGAELRSAGLKNEAAMVITNPTVGALYFERVQRSLADAGFNKVVRHDIPDSEEGKNWEEFSAVCLNLVSSFPDTGSVPLVINLGGGVVGDLGGFAAGVFRRGVPCVQVPTTLLSCVDSSVGGKVAVNHGKVKNILGIFFQPKLVFIDLAVLATLGPREIRSGSAEVIKYGGVCSGKFFEYLEVNIERLLALAPEVVQYAVSESCRMKAAVVEQDEEDKKGIRNVLNFGHTIGHALEMAAAGALTHGEAISIGMVAATRLAIELGHTTQAFYDRLEALLLRAGLPISLPESEPLFENVVRIMRMDKKFKDGRNYFVLPTEPGHWIPAQGVPQALIDAAIHSVLR